MKILGFDHVGICAKDPKAMADWYIEHLGFTPVSYTHSDAADD